MLTIIALFSVLHRISIFHIIIVNEFCILLYHLINSGGAVNWVRASLLGVRVLRFSVPTFLFIVSSKTPASFFTAPSKVSEDTTILLNRASASLIV